MFQVLALIFLLMTLPGIKKVKCDYYSSISGLEELIVAEATLVDQLESYIEQIENRITIVGNFLQDVEEESAKVKRDNRQLKNAFYYFRAIKRLTKDWKDLEYLILEHEEAAVYKQNITAKLKELGINLPTNEDLIGAVKGLSRLQNTYALKTKSLANGELLDTKYGNSLSASDCFQIGRILFEQKNYQPAIDWLYETKSRLLDQVDLNFTKITKNQYLELLAQAHHINGNTKLAAMLAQQQLPNNATNLKAVEELRHNEQILDVEEKLPSDSDLYEKTCRSELIQTPAQQRALRCRYTNNQVPFCLIAPFKLEELSLDPYVAYYHEIIYDTEIKSIIALAENRIERSLVRDDDVLAQYMTDQRTSKNTWLTDNEVPFMKNLAQRLEDITRLSIRTAEPMQVANYGIGGHYAPHLDEDDDIESIAGRRILTALLYINNVELGGATAFPHLQLAVPPIRRSLVLWYNLHESLELDFRTKHAGCPVLKGSKWICNIWFNDRGQEFNRPCSLQQMGYKSIDFVDR